MATRAASNPAGAFGGGGIFRESTVSLMCPLCSNGVAWQSVRWGETFLCPSCEGKVRIPPSYELTIGLLALAINASVVYSLGIRGVWLVICMAALYLPLNWVVVSRGVDSPRLQPGGGTSLLDRDHDAV